MDCNSVACANIDVGVMAKLQREKFSSKCVASEQRFKDSNLFPRPNVYHLHSDLLFLSSSPLY